MNFLGCVTVAAVFVALALAQYDAQFCRKYLDRVDDSSEIGIKPDFYDNFYLFMEIKDILNRSTYYVDEYYSEQSEMVYGTYRGKVNQYQVWIDATTNEILTGPNTKSVCVDAPLTGSTVAAALGATTDSTGDVTLNTPEVALGWHKKFQMEAKYSGNATSRGIKTVKWTVCSFNPDTQTTAVTDWYIVNPYKIVLPIVPDVQTSGKVKPILPVYAYSRGINKTNPQNISEFAVSIDFTFYDSIKPNSAVFQIPTTMLCSTKPSAQVPLPQPPSFFRFKGEQITIYDPSSQTPSAPELAYTVEEYMHELNIFVQDFITTPSSSDTSNDKSYRRVVNDYTTGVSFSLDLQTGGCTISVIPGGVDAIAIAGGKVKMRNSKQFFDLDSTKYQYMGVHKMRGIDCNTWSAYFNGSQSDHETNALYTWYFASLQWLNATGYQNVSQPMPISLEVQTVDSYVQFNFYEFDTQDGVTTPDLTLCFNESTTSNIQLIISATFNQVRSVTLESFRRAFYAAVMTQTSLNSVIRISRLNVQPAANGQTLVQFRLFDTANLPVNGDVVNAKPGVNNSQILSNLNSVINSGNFSVDVATTTINNSMTIVSFKAQPNSLAILLANSTSSSSGTSGYSSVTPVTRFRTSWISIPPPKGTLATSTSSSSETSGAMAGLAIGMILLGILLSVGAIFAFHRYRTPGKTSVVDMKRLDEQESET
ncbi:hypothetical protein BsWGS_29201 [Bradybaena similaris]